MKGLEHLIWDADGVLLDSSHVDLSVYAEMAKQAGLPFDRDAVVQLMRSNVPFTEIVKNIWGDKADSAEQIAESSRMFTEISAYDDFISRIKFFDGIPALLAELSAKNVIQCVATARDAGVAERILIDKLGVTEIRHIHGVSGISSDKTQPLNGLLRLYRNIPKKRVLFVTDSPSDIAVGNKLRIPTVGVGYGFCDIEHIKAAKPTYLAETVADLVTLIHKRAS